MRTRRLSWLVLIMAASLTAACSQTDLGITTKVKAKMAMDKAVRAYEIEVAHQQERRSSAEPWRSKKRSAAV